MRALVGVAVVAFVGLVAVFGFTPSETTDAHRAGVEEEVMKVAEAWMDVWRANDCEQSRGIMHPDRWVFILEGRTVTSVDEWVDYCTRTISNRAGWSGEWTDTEVRVLSPDAAVFIGTYSGTYQYRDGSPDRRYPVASQIINLERGTTGWGITSFQNGNGPSIEVRGG